MTRWIIPLALGCVALVLSGCGGGKSPANLTVRGKVTYKGNPANGVQVKLYAPDGGEYAGVTNTDGDFTIVSVPPGDMKVTIAEIATTGSSGPGSGGSGPPGGGGFKGPKQPKSDPKAEAMMKEKMKELGGDAKRPTAEASSKIPGKYADKAKSGLSWNVTADSLSKDFPLND
jgi:hypothetical protein